MLIVLDQFEQWLHAKYNEKNTELVQGLRQCDGRRVQSIVIVRDDFWLAVSRFVRDLEVDLLPGHNIALVDLFDLDHAKNVLAAFGRAFGRLPEEPEAISKEQTQFLSRAVLGLSQESKVICIRLALFAEMTKGKPWTPATLKGMGSIEGIGVTFLEDTFSAQTANPKHRLHQRAAMAVLKTLLPESGIDIKGPMRPYAELLAVSGYANRPGDFDELIRILDTEIRLITPTDLEGQEGGSASQVKGRARYFQLTHDYLVHSLRDWLTRKQKETRRGQAELLLADRAAVWNARPENRQLPSLWQWLSILWRTRKKHWTAPQRTMMRKASWYHVVRGWFVALVLVPLGGLACWEGHGRLKAHTLRDRLLEANTADVPGIVKEMVPYRRWLDPLLRDALAKPKNVNDPRTQLHASLALLPVDSGMVVYLYGQLLKAPPQEIIVIREALFEHKHALTEPLWTILENPKAGRDQRLRAACALASYAPDDPRWKKVRGDVAATLVSQEPFTIAQWTNALQPGEKWLIQPLAAFLIDEHGSPSTKSWVAKIYGMYAPRIPDAYALLENQLNEISAVDASVDAKIALAKKQASVGVALLVMGRGEKVWPLLKRRSDPTLRSYLIDRLASGGVDAKVLIARLDEEQDVTVRRAILLSLGEYGEDRLSEDQRLNLLARLLHLYRDDPDAGIHGASEWLLSQRHAADNLKRIDETMTTGKVGMGRQWYINRQGQTMIIVAKPGEFWMGEGKERHRQQVGRSFAIASKEVTVEQFLRFSNREQQFYKQSSLSSDCPVYHVSWYDAGAYCNWLSKQEGIPMDQWCYMPNDAGKYETGMETTPNYLHRVGYRLPTDAEWEYACRAGAETAYSFGESEDLLRKYVWYLGNSLGKVHPGGKLMPNDMGLFDMQGNVRELTQYSNRSTTVRGRLQLGYRGGSYIDQARFVTIGSHGSSLPAHKGMNLGFRLARTISP
jgi:formylglycine-generating enzyme required for sulfatase activity